MTPPEKEGLPVASASTVLDRIVASVDGESLGAYGVHVALGDDVAEHRWRSDDRVNVYSVSKGVSALARRAGPARPQGALSIRGSFRRQYRQSLERDTRGASSTDGEAP